MKFSDHKRMSLFTYIYGTESNLKKSALPPVSCRLFKYTTEWLGIQIPSKHTF